MSNVFYAGINFCVQGTFFSRNSFLKKGVKTFSLREKCLHKGSKYHFLLNIISLMLVKFFPRKCFPLKQFCSKIDQNRPIDQNKIFLKSFCY